MERSKSELFVNRVQPSPLSPPTARWQPWTSITGEARHGDPAWHPMGTAIQFTPFWTDVGEAGINRMRMPAIMLVRGMIVVILLIPIVMLIVIVMVLVVVVMVMIVIVVVMVIVVIPIVMVLIVIVMVMIVTVLVVLMIPLVLVC